MITTARRHSPLLDVLWLPQTSQLRDGRWKLVPRRLESVFEGRRAIHSAICRLDRIQAELGAQEHAPHCRDIDMDEVERLLRKARHILWKGMPDTQCDCPSWFLDCPKCKGHRWISRNSMAQPRATMLLTGRVTKQAALIADSASGKDMAATTVDCGDAFVNIVAYDDLAKKLSAIFSQRPVEVIGPLIHHRWKTGDGTRHQKYEVRVEQLTELPVSEFMDRYAEDEVVA